MHTDLPKNNEEFLRPKGITQFQNELLAHGW